MLLQIVNNPTYGVVKAPCSQFERDRLHESVIVAAE